MKKKLLIYAHYFYPDVASTGQILTELADGLKDTFDITVICVVPSYSGVVDEKYKSKRIYNEEYNGIKVVRVRVPEFEKGNKISRIKNLLAYFFNSLIATFKIEKQDYIFTISQPPILGGVIGVLGKWIKGRLENEGVLTVGDVITDETLRAYGRNTITMTKIKDSDDWFLDFGVKK